MKGRSTLKKTALIMAGGRGERFWPKSRKNLPKQFLSLTDDGKTMIQLTVERILPLVKMEDIYISTNRDYKELVRQQLPEIPEEPEGPGEGGDGDGTGEGGENPPEESARTI